MDDRDAVETRCRAHQRRFGARFGKPGIFNTSRLSCGEQQNRPSDGSKVEATRATRMTEGFKTGGRQKGTPNKMTKALKDMILGALEAKGGQEYLELQADKNPVAFLNLVGKVLPTTLQGDPDNPVHLSITEEQRRREVDAAIDAAFREYPREG
jgi:hypothetical protein